MRNFKSIFVYLLTTVICFGIASCSKDDYSSPIKGKTIGDMTFESSQSSNSISIGDADLTGFTVKSSDTWCVPSVQGKNINVAVQNNDTYGERKATVTITDPGDQSSVSFNVVQKQNNAILIDGNSYTVPETGGDVSIKVQSNVNYNVEIPASATWLTQTTAASTRGLESSTITLKASANNSGDDREAVVKLTDTASGTSSEFTVKQELKPVANIDTNEFTVDEEGGEVEVKVTSNIPIEVQYGDSWVSDGGKTGVDNFNFVQKIKVAALSGSQNRKTTVSFISQNSKWNVNLEVTIEQICNLSLLDSNIELMVGKSYELKVVNNTGGSLAWESSNTAVATVNSNGKVTGVSKGSAIITVKSADGKYSTECSVSVKEITDFISASSGGGSIMMINDLIKYGSSLGWIFNNNSTEKVRLKSLQLVDGVTGYEGNIMDVNEDVPAGGSVSYSTTIGLLGIHAPVTCRFRYEYNGKEYMTTAEYKSLW